MLQPATQSSTRCYALISLFALAFLSAIGGAVVDKRFTRDLVAAHTRALRGSKLLDTRCGPIEVQESGQGLPLLMIHGSGGGHDQGMDFAHALTAYGMRVIAVSRIGYLRTPMPLDASPEAQADAHVCVLDALGIAKAVVLGGSAGAPSALQTAIRHPQRVSALVLVVPIAYKPGDVPASTPEISDEADSMLLLLLGSDFAFWAALKVAHNQVFRHVLATPPELITTASVAEQMRVHSAANNILPVSARAAGLRSDTRLGKSLKPYALQAI